jgi:GTP-binding protein
MFSDRARIHVQAGKGGDGGLSFRREKFVPKGGPDGGDGGRGGDVVLLADPSLRDLSWLQRRRWIKAGRGENGRGARKHGADGDDIVLAVPVGTQITNVEDGTAVADLREDGVRVIVARGGGGGRGNSNFATPTRQTPRFAETGLPGESCELELHLKLMADAACAGLPNAGKSSLLGRITRAAPKVAGYPFTTLEPILGTIDDGDRQLVLADIPGLIEGAADGAGLGHEFLAHVERCRVLVHLLEIGEGTDPAAAYAVVRGELAAHGSGLDRLPELIVLSKSDLLPAEEVAFELDAWREGHPGTSPMAISSATGAGIDELVSAIFKVVADAAADHDQPASRPADATPEFLAEHRIYRPQGAGGFDVAVVADGVFEVIGRGVEMLVERHDLSNPEAIAYLERRLTEIGVIKALRDAGFESGDEVRVGDEAFELDI